MATRTVRKKNILISFRDTDVRFFKKDNDHDPQTLQNACFLEGGLQCVFLLLRFTGVCRDAENTSKTNEKHQQNQSAVFCIFVIPGCLWVRFYRVCGPIGTPE